MEHIRAVAVDSGYNSSAAKDAAGLFTYARELDSDAELYLLQLEHSSAGLPETDLSYTLLKVSCGGSVECQRLGNILSGNLPDSQALWLFAPDSVGTQVAAFFAVERKLPVASHITEVFLAGDKVQLKRMAYAGNLAAELELPSNSVVSLAKGVTSRIKNGREKGKIVIKRLDDIAAPEDLKIFFEHGENPLIKAERVFAVGRGVSSRTDLERIEYVADRLGAEIAVSRPIATNGWKPISRQLGISGEVISPEMCLLLGVSGTSAFLYGIRGAEQVLAVNNDKSAAVFNRAQSGTVADWDEFMEELEKLINKK